MDKIQASQAEFQPDKQRSPFVRSLHFTRQQRMNLLRWVLLILGCILCLVIQDCVMSRIKLFGATTDLGVAAILLVGLLEGTETGSIFALLASTVYYFSGSAPRSLLCGPDHRAYHALRSVPAEILAAQHRLHASVQQHCHAGV